MAPAGTLAHCKVYALGTRVSTPANTTEAITCFSCTLLWECVQWCVLERIRRRGMTIRSFFLPLLFPPPLFYHVHTLYHVLQGCSQWWTCQTSAQSTDRDESKSPLAHQRVRHSYTWAITQTHMHKQACMYHVQRYQWCVSFLSTCVKPKCSFLLGVRVHFAQEL